MVRRRQTPAQRRQVLRRTFETDVDREWRRYAGAPQRQLRRQLRERFVLAHLPATKGPVLEIGPGPGRFTPLVRSRSRGRLLLLDLSRAALLAGRRRGIVAERNGRTARLQGAAEHLPFRDRSIAAIVALGNISGMASHDGPGMFAEWARVTAPGAPLILDFASLSGSLQEFLNSAVQRRFLLRLLRRPDRYLVRHVLATGYQPYAPHRMARWEFRFYSPTEARDELTRAGFRVTDVMGVAPMSAFQERITRLAHREASAWETLLGLEEAVGRRSGAAEMGHGFVVAAVRTAPRRRPARRRKPPTHPGRTRPARAG